MRVILALSAVGLLVWSHIKKPSPALNPLPKASAAPVFQAPPQPVQPPPDLQLPGGAPPPFVAGRPLVIRVPQGYDGVPAGDYPAAWDGERWTSGWDRYTFYIYVTHVPTIPPGHSLTLWYSYTGNVLYPGRTLSEPRAFCDQHAIAPDGSWVPHGTSYRFPAATQPFLVFQP